MQIFNPEYMDYVEQIFYVSVTQVDNSVIEWMEMLAKNEKQIVRSKEKSLKQRNRGKPIKKSIANKSRTN